jgi:CTP synthase (UTP-ammonia lyase)
MARRCIGIIGDYRAESLFHQATNRALELSSSRLGIELEYTWVHTDAVGETGAKLLRSLAGIWASPGSPYVSIDGALEAIRFAREQRKPFFAT